MTGPDSRGLEDLVDAVGALIAIGVSGVVLRITHERGDLLPRSGRAFPLHEAAFHIDEIRCRRDLMRVPRRARHHDRDVVRTQLLELRWALVARVLRDHDKAEVAVEVLCMA